MLENEFKLKMSEYKNRIKFTNTRDQEFYNNSIDELIDICQLRTNLSRQGSYYDDTGFVRIETGHSSVPYISAEDVFVLKKMNEIVEIFSSQGEAAALKEFRKLIQKPSRLRIVIVVSLVVLFFYFLFDIILKN